MATQSQIDQLWDILRQHNQDKAIFKQAVEAAFSYLDTVPNRSVFPTPNALEKLINFDEPLPQTPHDAADVLALLHESGSPNTVAQIGGRYFGFVNGSAIPSAVAARWLADMWDQNAALHVISPIAAKLEQLCETWLVDLLGLPSGTAAGFVSGTSTATMCGLLAGRNALLRNQGWDLAESGLFGAPRVRVVMSKQSHGTVRKALAILGFGQANIEWVDYDDQGRIAPEKLPELDDTTLLILQAGNVNSGAFDDFVTIGKRAQAAGSWVHVDGAFGLWAAASHATQHLTEGIEFADSWSVDAHKTLNAPYDSGIVLCKDRDALVRALQLSGDYIQYSEERDNMLYTPEMSRRARGIELWALLKTLGQQGVDAMVHQLCQHAQQFGRDLAKHDFHILNDVVFNQVLVACDTPEETIETLNEIQRGSVMWCGGSQWNGEPVIRISVCSWATTTEDVKRSIDAIVNARQQARQQLG